MSKEERKTDDFLSKMTALEVSRGTLFDSLGKELNLIRVSAPIFIPVGTGIQDTLFKVPSKIKFEHAALPGCTLETLHSLAKWKRHILTEHSVAPYSGIYVEGHYIRGYEPILDETHSLYVL
jgi:aspartate--ammonia ligase